MVAYFKYCEFFCVLLFTQIPFYLYPNFIIVTSSREKTSAKLRFDLDWWPPPATTADTKMFGDEPPGLSALRSWIRTSDTSIAAVPQLLVFVNQTSISPPPHLQMLQRITTTITIGFHGWKQHMKDENLPLASNHCWGSEHLSCLLGEKQTLTPAHVLDKQLSRLRYPVDVCVQMILWKEILYLHKRVASSQTNAYISGKFRGYPGSTQIQVTSKELKVGPGCMFACWYGWMEAERLLLFSAVCLCWWNFLASVNSFQNSGRVSGCSSFHRAQRCLPPLDPSQRWRPQPCSRRLSSQMVDVRGPDSAGRRHRKRDEARGTQSKSHYGMGGMVMVMVAGGVGVTFPGCPATESLLVNDRWLPSLCWKRVKAVKEFISADAMAPTQRPKVNVGFTLLLTTHPSCPCVSKISGISWGQTASPDSLPVTTWSIYLLRPIKTAQQFWLISILLLRRKLQPFEVTSETTSKAGCFRRSAPCSGVSEHHFLYHHPCF